MDNLDYSSWKSNIPVYAVWIICNPCLEDGAWYECKVLAGLYFEGHGATN